jgi:selenium-binding protein 1
MLDGNLYLVDTRRGTARAVFDFNTLASGGWPQLIRLTRDGRRLFISLNQAGKVAMLDVSAPERPLLLSTLDLGKDSGPHYLALTPDEERLVVSDYFLNEDAFGKVHAEGDHKVHVARVTDRELTLDPKFRLDFDTAFETGPARPHGLVMR